MSQATNQTSLLRSSSVHNLLGDENLLPIAICNVLNGKGVFLTAPSTITKTMTYAACVATLGTAVYACAIYVAPAREAAQIVALDTEVVRQILTIGELGAWGIYYGGSWIAIGEDIRYHRILVDIFAQKGINGNDMIEIVPRGKFLNLAKRWTGPIILGVASQIVVLGIAIIYNENLFGTIFPVLIFSAPAVLTMRNIFKTKIAGILQAPKENISTAKNRAAKLLSKIYIALLNDRTPQYARDWTFASRLQDIQELPDTTDEERNCKILKLLSLACDARLYLKSLQNPSNIKARNIQKILFGTFAGMSAIALDMWLAYQATSEWTDNWYMIAAIIAFTVGPNIFPQIASSMQHLSRGYKVTSRIFCCFTPNKSPIAKFFPKTATIVRTSVFFLGVLGLGRTGSTLNRSCHFFRSLCPVVASGTILSTFPELSFSALHLFQKWMQSGTSSDQGMKEFMNKYHIIKWLQRIFREVDNTPFYSLITTLFTEKQGHETAYQAPKIENVIQTLAGKDYQRLKLNLDLHIAHLDGEQSQSRRSSTSSIGDTGTKLKQPSIHFKRGVRFTSDDEMI